MIKKSFYADLDASIRTLLLAQIRNLWTHTSTALEGNSLTLGDTAFILEEGLTVAGKPLRDHQEVIGHAKAIEIIYSLMAKDQIEDKDLFALHRAVLTDAVVDIFKPVGAWKNEPNFTTYISEDGRQRYREFPAPRSIPILMGQWLRMLNAALQGDLTDSEAVQVYADLHLILVTIHPFFDGNGRVARLIANVPVLHAGFPPIVVPTEARQGYKRMISDYQATIPDLSELKDLNTLPDNAERQYFREMCQSYWEPTQTLLRQAQTMQQHLVAGRVSG
ncbi:Fic family protein [Acidithiobacillus thiooxidans]|uniref:Fic family protein n=1 Tax=Acidithiobacillus thiooxidans TaxID=930 RepID=UPI0009DA25C1|nr:Fic family protein [Acidithiobacillus thiooxidans]MDD2748703.1 Fic family protein [Acidithiobacillus sp.]MDR7927147.1 Fic family protein [Acidithiobacillus thiooxidans]